jgi:hypothetical protein
MKPLPISESVPVAEHRTAEIRHVKAWRCSARKPVRRGASRRRWSGPNVLMRLLHV